MASFVERTQARAVRALLSLPPSVVRALAGPPQRNALAAELDPHAQLLARLQKLAQRPGYSEISVAAARAELALGVAVVEAAPPPGVRVEERMIDGAAGPLPARIYTPPAAMGVLPVLVFFHGGGFVVGSPAVYDAGCRTVAVEARCVVVSVDYRLAPEHRFPGCGGRRARRIPLGLCERRFARRRLHARRGRRGQRGRQPRGGDRAPRARRGRPAPHLPVARLSRDRHDPRAALAPRARRGPLPRRGHDGRGFSITTCPTRPSAPHPHASPLFAERHTDLPPACVVTAGFDPLRDEGAAYADRLQSAGVPVTRVEAPTLVHGFFTMSGVIPAAHTQRARAIDALRRGLHG